MSRSAARPITSPIARQHPRERWHPPPSSRHPLQRRRPLADTAAGIPRPAELLLPPVSNCLELLERQPVQIVDHLALLLLDDPAEQPRNVHDRRALVGQLEFDLAHLASLFAAAV